ncbi:hypothetical protein UMZ34_20265 [Halopseudomonas pachastrellae]|nr:hypothetical protein UMZ34_20265 [Halopseudomonas pachastrellae]
MSSDDQGNRWNVLMLEDNEDDALLIINHLETHGCDVSWTRIETEPDLPKTHGRYPLGCGAVRLQHAAV